MKHIKRAVLFLIFLGALFFLGPRTIVNTTIHFNPNKIGEDAEAYLAEVEKKIPGIRSGLEKHIVWHEGIKARKTPFSLVYIHGFSASAGELSPLPEQVATKLGANIFFTRLKGSGRDSAAMATANVNDWINDYEEAVEIGRKIGEKVIIMATSTGGSIATWRAAQNPAPKNVAAYIFVSPNFGINAKGSFLLTLPWSKQLVQFILGKEHKSSRAPNELYTKNWTSSYPTVALLPMAEMAKLAQNAPVENIKVPTYFIISDQDKVVDSKKTHSLVQKWGSIHDIMVLSWSGDPFMHVLSGQALSPSTVPFLRDSILVWLNNHKKS